MTVEVYAGAAEVELLLNGRSVGANQPERPIASGPFSRSCMSRDVWRQWPGRVAAEAGRSGSLQRSAPLKARSMRIGEIVGGAQRSGLRRDFRSGRRDTAWFMWAPTDVDLDVDGPAVLQGFGSANPATDEGFAESKCTTFDGRALAVVCPTGPGGSRSRTTAGM